MTKDVKQTREDEITDNSPRITEEYSAEQFRVRRSNGVLMGGLERWYDDVVLFSQVATGNINFYVSRDYSDEASIRFTRNTGSRYPSIYSPHDIFRIVGKKRLELSGRGRGVDNNNNPDAVIDEAGDFGIGVANPSKRLHVGGSARIDGEMDSQSLVTGNARTTGRLSVAMEPFGDENLQVTGGSRISGNSFFGFEPKESIQISNSNLTKYSTFVKGGVLSEDFAIAPYSNWRSNLIKGAYQPKALEEIETLIQNNKALPNMPTLKEIENGGYSLREMNMKLLNQVEDLMLYAIEQNKKIVALSERLDELEKKE